MIVYPRDEAEVVALIARARDEGRALRVVGSAHSEAVAIHAPHRPGQPEPLHLGLDYLDDVEFDDAQMQVHVGAGCRLGFDPRDRLGRSLPERGLCTQLDARGWALAALAGVTHQTIAGFLATGSATGSLHHGVAATVVGLRLVDGRGEVIELQRGRDTAFDAALVSLGLLGVVTRVRLQCEPRYAIRGREQVVEREDAPFDLCAEGPGGLMHFFAAHDYARVLWWPQPHVDRLVIWTADRTQDLAEPTRDYEAFPRVFGSRVPMQAAAGAALRAISSTLSATQPRGLAARSLGTLYRAFVPRGPTQRFGGPWHSTLPLDDQIDERWMPVSFTEIWVARADAPAALTRLARLFAEHGYAATESFACELYPAGASEAWLHPGHGRESLRINLFWLEGRAEHLRARWFERIYAAFEDLDFRLHWGKHTSDDPERVHAIATSYPRRREFLALRQRRDPDDLFYTPYWRNRLGLESTAEEDRAPSASIRATNRPPLVVHPLVFTMAPCDESLLDDAREHIHARAEVPAPAAIVDRNFTALVDAHRWLPQFLAVRWQTAGELEPGACFDEYFSFMSIRVRTLAYTPGSRWVAAFEASSLPLGTRTIEELRFEALSPTKTLVHWHVAFDPPPLLRPGVGLVAPRFGAWMQRGLDSLAAFHAQGP